MNTPSPQVFALDPSLVYLIVLKFLNHTYIVHTIKGHLKLSQTNSNGFLFLEPLDSNLYTVTLTVLLRKHKCIQRV